MENEKQEDAIAQVEEEINKTKSTDENLEIEISDEKPENEEPEQKAEEESKEKAKKRREDIERRFKKLVDQRRNAELEQRKLQEQNQQLEARLSKLEQGSQNSAQTQFNERYTQTKLALEKAVEEGDTKAQVEFSEQLADMRAAIRIAEMQKQQQAQQNISPTVGRAQQTATNPAPPKAMDWWQKNRWFNSNGYERETAAARAIDVQLDLEGYDQDTDEYYDLLNSRLQKVFPEVISKTGSTSQERPRAKSSQPVTPSAGGSGLKTNRVRMTQDQLRMARELGITDEKALRRYSKEIQSSNRS